MAGVRLIPTHVVHIDGPPLRAGPEPDVPEAALIVFRHLRRAVAHAALRFPLPAPTRLLGWR